MCHLSTKLVLKEIELEFWGFSLLLFFRNEFFSFVPKKKKLELKNGEKSSSTSSFDICPCYEEYSFSSCEGGVGRVLGGNMP
jgi:hypothetical protein